MATKIAQTLFADLRAKRIPAIHIDTIFAAIDKVADITVLTRRRREDLADLVTRKVVTMSSTIGSR